MMERYQIKRFMELWIGDSVFRERLAEDPRKTVREYSVNVDPEAISFLYNGNDQDYDSLPRNVHPGLKAYLTKIRKMNEFNKKMRKRAGISNKVFAKWMSRQKARLAGQDHSRESNKNPHMPFAIELTKGCSIQCDYCGLDASPLKAVALFTRENEKLFYDILRSFIGFFGEGCDTGLLYWATESLDNPDYEKYLKAFYDVFGKTPETTTAGWFRDVGRTRRLLKQIRQQGGLRDRFSINSADHLSFCMKTFSARELENVGLVINHSGSLSVITATGRGRRVSSSINRAKH